MNLSNRCSLSTVLRALAPNELLLFHRKQGSLFVSSENWRSYCFVCARFMNHVFDFHSRLVAQPQFWFDPCPVMVHENDMRARTQKSRRPDVAGLVQKRHARAYTEIEKT